MYTMQSDFAEVLRKEMDDAIERMAVELSKEYYKGFDGAYTPPKVGRCTKIVRWASCRWWRFRMFIATKILRLEPNEFEDYYY